MYVFITLIHASKNFVKLGKPGNRYFTPLIPEKSAQEKKYFAHVVASVLVTVH